MEHRASGSPRFSFANGSNVAFIESLFEKWRQDPEQVDPSWRKFFEGYEFARFGDTAGGAEGVQSRDVAGGPDRDTARVEAFINAYRRLGHLSAHLNPLEEPRPMADELKPEANGLGDVASDRPFHPANLPLSNPSFQDIVALLQETYCGKIGADFRDLNDVGMIVWLQERMESCRNKPAFSPEERRRIFAKLAATEGFEQFLGRRYIGAKRFSLEGLDAVIPLLDLVAADAVAAGCEEMVVGMAHRGRLNVLANFLGKPAELILKEFEGTDFTPFDIDGDVKYHMGFTNEVNVRGAGKIRLHLSPNPSHLEAVNPVVEGIVRARQRLLGDQARTRVLPLLMHGDAAFMGQGGVAETLNLSRLPSYSTGGTIHVITNNQIGFTCEPWESRSGVYASDIAKMIRAPVLHVNADDPEAVLWCGRLAVEYRQKFHADIVIDVIGYRRHGHNEGDEPAFTQPLMYKDIGSHLSVLRKYSDELVAAGVITADAVTAEVVAVRDGLQAAYDRLHGKAPAKLSPAGPVATKAPPVKKPTREDMHAPCATGVPVKALRALAERLTSVPAGFTPHPKLLKVLEQRRTMFDGDGHIDWGLAELLAFAAVAADGRHVRLSGQDCGRGTFTSRHAIWVDVKNAARHESLNALGGSQGYVEVINSPLSEQGVLGFEFGYSVADPEALVCWEAQFGDFANGAQVLIDQFLSASESKWKQTSGLVLLLPHGYEGQGPEHSSARPERFLQLCGNLNLQVVIPTTPAQHFHALRRQVARAFRKPLIVMTPKSLLREPLCVSRLEAFERGRFQELIDDESPINRGDVERLIACSGKVYYDLVKARTETPRFAAVPIIRIEQPYPFPYEAMHELLSRYPRLKEVIWTQEEPQNMGGWNFVRGRFGEVLDPKHRLTYVGRKNSGTPAEGSLKAHEAEQRRIVQDAFLLATGGTARVAAAGS